MAIHEFLVCAVSDPENYRKKEGDVIAVRPYGWNWGYKELSRYLVVLVEDDRTSKELNDLTLEGIYEDGQKESVINEIETNIMKSSNGNKEIKFQRPIKLSKYRLKIPLLEINKTNSEIDLEKVRDSKLIYQPFKTIDKIVEKFTGKNGNRLLDSRDVDTGLNPKKEFIINKSDGVKLIVEKTI